MEGRTRWWALPNSAFGIVLGIAGNAVMWRTLAGVRFTEKVLGKTGNWTLCILGLSAYLVIFGLMIVKMCFAPRLLAREWRHPTRAYFFFAPHLALLMLTIASPQSLDARLRSTRTASFVVCFLLQTGLALTVYERWMFSPIKGDIGSASPPYLLATVGWPLLCVLAQVLELERRWHFDIASCLFGCGVVFYSLAFISIAQTMHTRQHARGAPVLFLIVAPPSVLAIALANFNGGRFGSPSTAVLGFCLFMVLLLIRLGPRLLDKPSTLGVYWAYVFPLASVATAAVRYADTFDTRQARGLAWALVALATFALVVVFVRMSVHVSAVLRGHAFWSDPLMCSHDDDAAHEVSCELPRWAPTTSAKPRHNDTDEIVDMVDDDDDDCKEPPSSSTA